MWVARDKDGTVRVWEQKPFRYENEYVGKWCITGRSRIENGLSLIIPSETFPNLKWEDDPLEIDFSMSIINELHEKERMKR